MTEKELLYVEDAIGHERSIIDICEESINNLDNDEFISFMEQEKINHQNIANNLMELLRGKANE